MSLRFTVNEKSSFWDVVKALGLTEEDIVMEYKAWFMWHNRTKPDLVLTLLMDWRFRALAKVRLYLEVILKTKDKRAELFDMQEFEKALNEEVTVYRGNAGVFNPDYEEKFHFVAMTASFDTALMFAKYPDAKVTHLSAPPQAKQYWVVGVTLPLKNIMAYRDMSDIEVWIGKEYYKNAKVLVQCGV